MLNRTDFREGQEYWNGKSAYKVLLICSSTGRIALQQRGLFEGGDVGSAFVWDIDKMHGFHPFDRDRFVDEG